MDLWANADIGPKKWILLSLTIILNLKIMNSFLFIYCVITSIIFDATIFIYFHLNNVIKKVE